MELEMQTLVNGLFTAAFAMGGWILGRITKSLDQLDRDVREMPKVYVTKADVLAMISGIKDDFKSETGEIKDALVRIESKLDNKQDK